MDNCMDVYKMRFEEQLLKDELELTKVIKSDRATYDDVQQLEAVRACILGIREARHLIMLSEPPNAISKLSVSV